MFGRIIYVEVKDPFERAQTNGGHLLKKNFQNVLIILNIGNHYKQNSWLVNYTYYLQIKIHFIENVQNFEVEIEITPNLHTTKKSMTFILISLNSRPPTLRLSINWHPLWLNCR